MTDENSTLLNVFMVSPEEFITMLSQEEKYKLVKNKNLYKILSKCKPVYCVTVGDISCYCIEKSLYG